MPSLISLYSCMCMATAALAAHQPPALTQSVLLNARQTGLPDPATTIPTSALPTGVFTVTKKITIPGITNDHLTKPPKTIELAALPTCVQTITPDQNGYVPPGTCGSLWAYYPSFAAALAFAGLFGVILGLHIWQAARYKTRWCWVIIMAAVWETLAFTFRAISAKNQQSEGILLVFQIFILLAPLWVNAFAYMTLGRMIHFFHPSKSLLSVPASTIAAIFVLLDVVSFIIQLIGGGSAGPNSPPETQRRGLNIYMAGIALQEFFILVFAGMCVLFQQQMRKRPGTSPGKLGGLVGTPWGPLLSVLLVSLSLITVRVVYRLIEFSGGLSEDNELATNEGYFFALEAVPMLFAIFAFNVTYPGRVITGPGSEMPGIITMIRIRLSRRKGRQVLLDEAQEADGFSLKERNNLA